MVMDDVKRKTEIIGASSILVFACGPGRSVMCFCSPVSYLSHQSCSLCLIDFYFDSKTQHGKLSLGCLNEEKQQMHPG
jgi:hypothetical protein